ncbi:MAG: hypothetical protein HYT75_07665 [Deltaproteobacteria bacterium]|nr:hypothetical protein [Deltaproteobacteria bacterium]
MFFEIVSVRILWHFFCVIRLLGGGYSGGINMMKNRCYLNLCFILFLVLFAHTHAYAATVQELNSKCNECWGYENYSKDGCEVKYPYDTKLSGAVKNELKCNLRLAFFCATKELPKALGYRAFCGTDEKMADIAGRRIFFNSNIQYHYLDAPITIKGEVTAPDWLPLPGETGLDALDAYKKNIPFITIDGAIDGAAVHIAPSESWIANGCASSSTPCYGLLISQDNAANMLFKNLVFENFFREAMRILSDKYTLKYKSIFLENEKKYNYYQ